VRTWGRPLGGGASAGEVGIDPNAVYSLGSSRSEGERLQRQADELAPESEALLDRIQLKPARSSSVVWLPLRSAFSGVRCVLASRV